MSKQPYLKFAAVRVRRASDVHEPVLTDSSLATQVRASAPDEDPGTVPMGTVSR